MLKEYDPDDVGFTEYSNTSRLIFKGPAIVESITISAHGANGDVIIYNGENAKGEIKFHIDALSGHTAPWNPGRGAKFNNGIYIVVNAATTHVSITYRPVSVGPGK